MKSREQCAHGRPPSTSGTASSGVNLGIRTEKLVAVFAGPRCHERSATLARALMPNDLRCCIARRGSRPVAFLTAFDAASGLSRVVGVEGPATLNAGPAVKRCHSPPPSPRPWLNGRGTRRTRRPRFDRRALARRSRCTQQEADSTVSPNAGATCATFMTTGEGRRFDMRDSCLICWGSSCLSARRGYLKRNKPRVEASKIYYATGSSYVYPRELFFPHIR